MSVFNTNQVDHHAQPMFFGDDTGVARYDDPKHSMFEGLTEKQLSFFWRPEEVSVAEDRAQFQAMPVVWQNIFTNNLKYQTLLDSVQGRAPSLAFMDVCSDVGLETWIATWTFSETIHSRSYTHIMRNVYTDPGKEFETIVLNDAIMKRANSVAKYYDQFDADKIALKDIKVIYNRYMDNIEELRLQLADYQAETVNITQAIAQYKTEQDQEDMVKYLNQELTAVYTLIKETQSDIAEAECEFKQWEQAEYIPVLRTAMKSLYLCMHSVNTLEAIRFYVSFACTFNFHKNNNGLMEGNSKIMKLIARDEQLHLKGTQYMINYWRSGKEGPLWQEVCAEAEEEATQIFLDVVEQEKEWVDYLFKDGTVPGLNHEVLYAYIEYLAHSRMQSAGLKSPFTPGRHPLPWIREYLNSEAVQVAPQEVDLSSYLVGQVHQDINEEHFHKFQQYL